MEGNLQFIEEIIIPVLEEHLCWYHSCAQKMNNIQEMEIIIN